MLASLKEEVLEANLALHKSGLAPLTWGNVSGLSEDGLVVIKPSGVEYSKLKTEHLVVLDLEGKQLEGDLRPSSDTPTHLKLYQAFPEVRGIAHSHSVYAVQWAQAGREIPPFGTTHADHFFGAVPLARGLTPAETESDYEGNTAVAIIERFKKLNPLEIPAVLLSGHGPFSWGKSPMEAFKNSFALEQCAQMAFGTLMLNPSAPQLAPHILAKHYNRKHGAKAYYGQK